MCEVYLLTAVSFSLALLACKLVHMRCMFRNLCLTYNLERHTPSSGWKATPANPTMHLVGRALHSRHSGCSCVGRLASCPPAWWGELGPAPAFVLHCLLSNLTFHVIAIHCLVWDCTKAPSDPWVPNTYLLSGFLTGKEKYESSVPKTTVSLKRARTGSFCIGGFHLQKPVTPCLILWSMHAALSISGLGTLRAFSIHERGTSSWQKHKVPYF